MSNYDVVLYSKKDKSRWDTFIDNAPGTTFLLRRDFMEYHAHKFQDHSLIISDNSGIVAVMPANISGDTVCSHQGLTYGGIFFEATFDNVEVEAVLQSILAYLKEQGVKVLDVKLLPEFYADKTTQYLNSLLHELQADIYRNDRVFAIDYSQPFTIHKTKLKHYRKSQEKDFVLREETDLTLFWNEVLIPRLREKHNTAPVHSLKEIHLLKSRFNKEIKQFNVYIEDTIVAGITIFEKGQIVKSQYGATTALGEKVRALEYLFLNLIFKYKSEGKSYFSMGTVRDLDMPLGYNPGLLRQKVELGCREYCQHFFKISIV
jgi:hypothetical protein